MIAIDQQSTYEKADFESGKVFEYICGLDNAYQQSQEERRLAELAKAYGFKDFKKILSSYKKEIRRKSSMEVVREAGISEFGDQPFELNTGEWTADDAGVWKYAKGNGNNLIQACTHPIFPCQIYVGVDTGRIRLNLAYRRGADKKEWNFVVVDAAEISSATKIVDRLAPLGVSVTSGERANALVDYLRDVRDLNYDVIPHIKSVSRMGWNDEGFSPYADGVAFDGADAFRPVFNALVHKGTEKAWIEEALDARSYSLTARVILAASFASALVQPLGCLPFFVHLWGMDSGTGKTVAQMLGASVWGDPVVGAGYFQTFKGTTVGFELMAGFLHSLPLFLDELQLAKDKHGNVIFNVYELASGAGKLRSNKGLGLNYTPTWANCFITSGETPIVSQNDGAGALNRVIEIECRANDMAIRDGHRTANVLKKNYGFAGKLFVGKFMESGNREYAAEIYERRYAECVSGDATGKQAMAAALILTADELATEWIFKDRRSLRTDEISEFLKSTDTVSASQRGYDAVTDWVTMNASRFKDKPEYGECYGILEGDTAYVIRSVWDRICLENGISSKALLSHLRTRKLIICDEGSFTKAKRINGQPTKCVWLKMPEESDFLNEEKDLPF
ncbi:MAG: DUF927 domain-containing protein [Oscillospiraceae bacterium]